MDFFTGNSECQEAERGIAGFIADGAVLEGNICIGKESSIWFHVTIRADRDRVSIGEGSNIQDNVVVHVDRGYPVTIGDYVSVGHGAILHGCKIGDNTVVGMGAILLNGCRIGKNCIIGAGTLITQETIIPDNSLVMGSPGKIMRQILPQEAASNRKNASSYIEESREYERRKNRSSSI